MASNDAERREREAMISLADRPRPVTNDSVFRHSERYSGSHGKETPGYYWPAASLSGWPRNSRGSFLSKACHDVT